jgi:hypothetical protein
MPLAATIDPFDGKQLKLKHTDQGWVVYTVMLDGVDDSGNFIQLHDYGVAPLSRRVEQEKEDVETPEANEAAPQAK